MIVRLRGRKRRCTRVLLAAVILGGTTAVLIVAALSALIVWYGRTDRARPADVIIVLGGGVAGTERRALHAAALYRQAYAPVVLCTGGAQPGSEWVEAAWCAEVVQRAGVPPAAILLENTSHSTEENAVESAAIMRARGWTDAVLVSDDFHLWRANWLFEEQGIRAWPSPAQRTTGALPRRELPYAVLREIVGIGWHLTRSPLGLR